MLSNRYQAWTEWSVKAVFTLSARALARAWAPAQNSAVFRQWITNILILETSRGGGVRGLEGQIDFPSIFLALNFCSLTNCQKLWYSCALFVNTSFDTN